MRAILADLGQDIVEAYSGEEALQRLEAQEFAVVLLDVLMPGMSGFETAKRIRSNPRSRRTPIIFVTASDVDRPQLEEGYSLGAVDFLTKPLLPNVIQSKVRGFVELFLEKQQALREAEQLRMLIQGTVDYAIFMLGPDGHVLTWNSGAERLKGYKAAEIIGQHFSRFYPAEARERGWPDHELEVARSQGRFEDEGWRLRKDGSMFWANVVISAIRDEKGGLRGYSKVTRDLTNNKESQERLLASEERFRLLIETVKDYAIFLLDPQGRVATWNEGARRIKQYSSEEIIGKHFSYFYTQESIKRGWPEYELKVAEKEGRFEDEGWRVRKDGSQFWANVVITTLRDKSGAVRGFAKITRDMTDRKRAEESARQLLEETTARRVAEESSKLIQTQRERLRVTLASIGDAVISTDAEGRIDFLNAVAQKLTGWNEEEAVSRPLVEVFHIINEETRQPVDNPAMRALKDGRVVGLANHTILIASNGTELPIDDSAAPIRDSQGNVVGSVLVFRDIGELKRANQALREADRRKDEFLATLAHELRNPLAPIRNSLQILKTPQIDAAVAEHSREVLERQVHHLVRLVDDLLDVSRVMRGKIDLRKEPVELASIVTRAVETAQSLIDANGHKLELSIPSESLLLDADPVRLAQVVGNLLVNSAKYTPCSGHIGVTAQREGNQVVLRIRDNGIGIAPDMLPHVFELFVQADHTTTKAQGGLGIGLTLVKNLTEMHGGSIVAHSAGLGKGCEFELRLPLLLAKRSVSVAIPAESRRPGKSPQGHRLLVVDDNRDSAMTLALLLRLKGHEVQVAHDGMSAIELARSYGPKLVFLDLGMPGMDGYEVARRMRQQPGLENVVLAAVTGWGQQEDRRRTADAGFDHHLVKPLEPMELDRLLMGLDH
ncbi:MAG: PAS domain S-box protein [Planctomycetales bacterium]|nr:PAS domain S-box protein [Planctomycetales bacterium]